MRTKYKGNGLAALNGGPYMSGELVALFEEITPRALASAWVACLADAFDMGFIQRTGDLVRPLLVVSRRLHGVKFDDALLEVTAAMTQPNSTARKPGMLSDDEARRMPPPQPAAKKKPEKFIVRPDMMQIHRNSPPPGEMPGVAAKVDPLKKAICELPIGGWIEINPAPQRLNGLVMKCKGIERHHDIKGLRVYRSQSGSAIIIREDVPESL